MEVNCPWSFYNKKSSPLLREKFVSKNGAERDTQEGGASPAPTAEIVD
jgi:hypothetical protein